MNRFEKFKKELPGDKECETPGLSWDAMLRMTKIELTYSRSWLYTEKQWKT